MKRFFLLSLLVAMTTSFMVTPSLFGDEELAETAGLVDTEVPAVEALPTEDAATFSPAELNDFKIDNLWIMFSGCLVFIMHLGFASL
ncbi:MAG: hypothetical protein ACKVK0_16990, partial [Pirellulales bacterium]